MNGAAEQAVAHVPADKVCHVTGFLQPFQHAAAGRFQILSHGHPRLPAHTKVRFASPVALRVRAPRPNAAKPRAGAVTPTPGLEE
ncbi:hypothetical protein JCM14719A_14470 [Calditerricola satsumensis]|uniref:Uncharacterized protein n=1 Tax=Calditerricola satsumensis TaxID=373054 RepID=A0A8J3B859_9BACI|nr:hypothetical protein GCM10007043_07710 [Calditerricola satsumensis]